MKVLCLCRVTAMRPPVDSDVTITCLEPEVILLRLFSLFNYGHFITFRIKH